MGVDVDLDLDDIDVLLSDTSSSPKTAVFTNPTLDLSPLRSSRRRWTHYPGTLAFVCV